MDNNTTEKDIDGILNAIKDINKLADSCEQVGLNLVALNLNSATKEIFNNVLNLKEQIIRAEQIVKEKEKQIAKFYEDDDDYIPF